MTDRWQELREAAEAARTGVSVEVAVEDEHASWDTDERAWFVEDAPFGSVLAQVCDAGTPRESARLLARHIAAAHPQAVLDLLREMDRWRDVAATRGERGARLEAERDEARAERDEAERAAAGAQERLVEVLAERDRLREELADRTAAAEAWNDAPRPTITPAGEAVERSVLFAECSCGEKVASAIPDDEVEAWLACSSDVDPHVSRVTRVKFQARLPRRIVDEIQGEVEA